MATIQEISQEGRPAFVDQLRAMEDEHLLGQDLVQQGAVHALSQLLQLGCTKDNADAMLDSLRHNAQLIRDEAARRGKSSLFDVDQVAGQAGGEGAAS